MKINWFVLICILIQLAACTNKNPETMKPYVIEVTTFKYKSTVDTDTFWSEDAKVQANYTSRQHGFISRESGYSKDSNEVLVLVRWKTATDADASMHKFMEDKSVTDYVNMIQASTMQMTRYKVN